MEKNPPQDTSGRPIRCRAAICRKAGDPLVIEEIEVSPPKSFEARIRILCTSLCHSDVTFWKMEGPLSRFPRIFGHEAVGVVESVGDGVEGFKVGDTVVPVFLPDCEDCKDCKSEQSNMCSKLAFEVRTGMPRDGTSRLRDGTGETVYHFLGVSSFAEYTVVDVAHLVKMDCGIDVDKACLLSCGVSTGIGAAWKVAQVQKGSSVVIFGLGSVGLAVAEGARLRGASKIIGVDVNPEKLTIGKQFGVTHFLNPKDLEDKPVHEVIKEMTDGGADYSFECIGLASLMNDAFLSCRSGGGKTIILGVEMHGAPLTINSFELLLGKSVLGTLFGGIKPKSDIPLLAKRYLDKEFELDHFITHKVNFEDINKAFDLLLQGKSLRCIIWM